LKDVCFCLIELRVSWPAGEDRQSRAKCIVARGREKQKSCRDLRVDLTHACTVTGNKKMERETDRGFLVKETTLASAFVGLAQLETENRSDQGSQSC
jgi:hypothetical protein